MTTFNNPFSIDRAEQLGDDLFKFFAKHDKLEGLLKRKSLVVEGGRGTGKTMFFLYHTYWNKKKEALSNGQSFDEFIESEDIFGLHFRADTNFVPAFQYKEIEDSEWVEIFAHFLNITLGKRIVEMIIDINENIKEINKIDFTIGEKLQTLLGSIENINSYSTLLKIIEIEEIKLMKFINNTALENKPTIISSGFLVNLLCSEILKTPSMKDKSVHIFIDEYENLLGYQQEVVNTLIKHPNPTIFNIGMRKEGWKTHQTLTKTEIIRAPDDFNHYDFEDLTPSEYGLLIKDICTKRLASVYKNEVDEKFTNIEFFLGNYSVEEELGNIVRADNLRDLNEQIKKFLKEKRFIDDDKIDKYSGLYSSEDFLLARLILVLLNRGRKAEELSEELNKYNNRTKSKFDDWLHNNKIGLIFLICKEFNKDKEYFGFNTYKQLSSGIIRYFIELCEVAFKNAYRNGFSFDKPRILSYKEQSEAAYYVSKYKVDDIETFPPYSNRLKRFVILLGKVFAELHSDEKLSEPERNHFGTEYNNLKKESQLFLKNAALYSVIQVKDETKDKNVSIDSNRNEFHLNHIYTPYFQISPRQMRKLEIKYHILEKLISEDNEKAEEAAKTLIKNIFEDDNGQLKINLN